MRVVDLWKPHVRNKYRVTAALSVNINSSPGLERMASGYSVGLCIALALLCSASLSAALHHLDDSNMVVACPLSPVSIARECTSQ